MVKCLSGALVTHCRNTSSLVQGQGSGASWAGGGWVEQRVVCAGGATEGEFSLA